MSIVGRQTTTRKQCPTKNQLQSKVFAPSTDFFGMGGDWFGLVLFLGTPLFLFKIADKARGTELAKKLRVGTTNAFIAQIICMLGAEIA